MHRPMASLISKGRLPRKNNFSPREMKKLGYETAIVGKWHLKHEPANFDYYHVLPGQGNYFEPEIRVRGTNSCPQNTVQTSGHSSDRTTDASKEWLKNKRSIVKKSHFS